MSIKTISCFSAMDKHKTAPCTKVQGAHGNSRLGYEFATPQWEEGQLSHQLRSGDQHAHRGQGRLDLRPRAGQSRQEQLRAAARRWRSRIDDKTMLRSGYGMSYIHFNRLGGENLLSFNGPHVVGAEHHTAAVAAAVRSGNSAPTTCFRTTQQGYPEGLTSPANFNPLNARVNYIPQDNPTGNVRAGTSRCSAKSCRTCWSTSATSATRAATS